MTNTPRFIGLIMTAALWVGGAAAQDLPLPTWDDATPHDLSLPAPGDRSMLAGPGPDRGEPFAGYDPESYEHFAPGLHDVWPGPSAPIESTGTWLRRGFWYAEAEGVVYNRMWLRSNKIFAGQDPNLSAPFFNPLFVDTNRLLIVDGASPGRDAAVRATLGNFLFRDSKNRDHTVEFTVFGGGDWHQHRVISSEMPFGLFVPHLIDGGNRSFDGSSRQTIDYSSRFNSFELNYAVKQRLRRDQIIMDANGHWHRAANPGIVREYLVGLRMVEARDILNWRAEDIQAPGNDGEYLIRADNDMIGFQLGTGLTWESSRWSVGIHGKGGVYLNDALGRTTLEFTADDFSDADLRLRENEISWIGEAKVLGRWHLTPNFSLRASYEVMHMTSQALAPVQATFITDFAYLNTSRDLLFHGFSFGLEGYW